jgi:guanylate kinase
VKRHSKIFIISGPSGSGKTTLYQNLLHDPEFKNDLRKSVSVTTRAKRPGERHGKDYLFVSPKMFLYKKRAGHFLESEQVFDHFYGTPAKQVCDLLRAGRHVLLSIDVLGAATVRNRFKNTVTVFIKPPSLSVLKERLQKRGSESDRALALRLKRVKQELAESRNYDYVIVNHDLHKAFSRLRQIVRENLNCCCQ